MLHLKIHKINYPPQNSASKRQNTNPNYLRICFQNKSDISNTNSAFQIDNKDVALDVAYPQKNIKRRPPHSYISKKKLKNCF